MTKKSSKIRTDKDLIREFLNLDSNFFDERLQNIIREVRFDSTLRKRLNSDGAYHAGKKTIFIDSLFKGCNNVITVILLHEMVHADLMSRGHRGYPADGGHGTLFQVELHRIYQVGGYEGLL
jgi:hypothetical protein